MSDVTLTNTQNTEKIWCSLQTRTFSE